MDILYALLLGIIEGVTEFLPISSTAHLVVAEDLMGFKDSASVFTVVIQLGAILAAAVHFRTDLVAITRSAYRGDTAMQKFILSVLVGLIPSVIIGLIVEKTIGIPDALPLIGTALILGGIGMLIIEQKVRSASNPSAAVRYTDITTKKSLMIGIGQTLAIIPGVSRSGATIMTGLLAGLDRKTATVFSFYLSIPIMIGASALKLIDDHSTLQNISGGVPALVVGTIAAFVSALIVIRWFIGYVQSNTFRYFAYYRIAVGALLLICITVYNYV